jgi:magnesium transporter
MIEVILTEGDPPRPLWLDVAAPTDAELEKLAEDYRLHPMMVMDSVQPLHLPKHERVGGVTFMIIRAFDEEAKPTDDSVQALTRKLAFFLGDRFLITIHRKSQAFVKEINEQYKQAGTPVYLQVLLLEILAAAVDTFQKPIEDAESQVHHFQVTILSQQPDPVQWEELFRTQTRLLVIKRLLWHTQSAVQRFVPFSSVNQPIHQDVRERIESLQFFADSLLDDLRNLLTIQLALGAHNTNQVMRILAVFTAFFMPMTFITGIYGMNFSNMPEIGWRYGYLMVWCITIVAAASIYYWFRRKKLL